MEEKRECCHTTKTKERTEKEYKDLIHRLNRIEGQVRGISAVYAALNSFSKVLLGNHIRTCVAEDIRQGKEETVEELVATLQKLMK